MPTHVTLRGRPARRWLRRDKWRALAVSFLFAGAAAAGMGVVIRHLPSSGLRAGASAGQGDDDLTTGSIIFVPILGDTCRKKLIDNATWRIRDGGYVKCRDAMAQNTRGQFKWSASRVDVVRQGFYNR